MTFNYRFNNILKVKEMTEEDKKNQMAYELTKLNLEEENLKCLLEKKELNICRWNELTKDNNVISIKELKKASMDIEKINSLVDSQTTKVKRQQGVVDESRRQLAEAKKQTKIFQKLKEKDYQRFLEVQSKIEANLIDQLVTYKSTANRGG